MGFMGVAEQNTFEKSWEFPAQEEMDRQPHGDGYMTLDERRNERHLKLLILKMEDACFNIVEM